VSVQQEFRWRREALKAAASGAAAEAALSFAGASRARRRNRRTAGEGLLVGRLCARKDRGKRLRTPRRHRAEVPRDRHAPPPICLHGLPRERHLGACARPPDQGRHRHGAASGQHRGFPLRRRRRYTVRRRSLRVRRSNSGVISWPVGWAMSGTTSSRWPNVSLSSFGPATESSPTRQPCLCLRLGGAERELAICGLIYETTAPQATPGRRSVSISGSK
jgi:hypothetical protein